MKLRRWHVLQVEAEAVLTEYPDGWEGQLLIDDPLFGQYEFYQTKTFKTRRGARNALQRVLNKRSRPDICTLASPPEPPDRQESA